MKLTIQATSVGPQSDGSFRAAVRTRIDWPPNQYGRVEPGHNLNVLEQRFETKDEAEHASQEFMHVTYLRILARLAEEQFNRVVFHPAPEDPACSRE